ncbi:MAG: histidine phosphatase family protein [Bacteroidetes bacterium]|nr:histidine phosphatase family protein [Bacteroidota bacterium]
MKQLLLIRHAKSSWANMGMSDIERPLNDRGEKDAPEMAKRLLQKDIIPQLLVTSTATRARTTCEVFASVLAIAKKNILETAQLYMAKPSTYWDVIAALPNEAATVALFAHNPGITEFANELTHVRIDNMPTCSIFAVNIRCENWKDFKAAEKTFSFFDWPKNPSSNPAVL